MRSEQHKIWIFLFALFISVTCIVASVSAQQITSDAREAILYDAETGTVLFSKNADNRMPTASMSKVITMLVVFDAVREKRLGLQETLTVSETAWRKGGSKMFVPLNARVTVEDLIKGVVVQSGNDATIVLAEGIAGSEEAFVRLLNEKAAELGMDNSNFNNASGWPDENHYSTARDLLILAKSLVTQYPEFYHYYALRDFTYNNIRQPNRNPLLARNIGADGIKTGHTTEAGYGLMASAVQDNRRLILVVNGLASQADRATESARLLGLGFSQYTARTLYKAGEEIHSANVWMGSKRKVSVTVADDLKISVPRSFRDDIQMKIHLVEPLQAPIAAGQVVGTIDIQIEGLPEAKTVNLVAAETVYRAGFLSRVWQKLHYFLFGLG